MKKIATKVMLMLTIATMLFAFQPEQNTKLPDLDVEDLDGKKFKLSEYGDDGQITIISFWATWCKPCLKELSAINDNYEDWQEDADFKVVAVSIDDARTKAKVKPFAKAYDWPFDVVIDEAGESKRKFNYQTPPYSLIVDKHGNIVYRHSGYLEGDEDDLHEHLIEIAEKD
ncbi:MAG: TlpA family protein disulfide reductase [Bacteroidetes bacterium]|nr:TlpA family protein disulfide reductase [Bacteroidota bacterium]